MEPGIITLARQMREAFFRALGIELDADAWNAASRDDRRGWVAAALVAAPELGITVAVHPDHELAGILCTYQPREEAPLA